MKKLIKGLHKFQTEVFPIHKDFFQDLATGQNPETLFITCSDSRINPHMMTSSKPGELFIMRNAGNIIPPYDQCGSEASTIEFAVGVLGVQHIIICGHSHCGAVQAVFDIQKTSSLPSLQCWIGTHIQPTLKFVQSNYPDISGQTLMDILLQEHVLQQVENLKTYPIVADALANHSVTLHAWVYTFEEGDIFAYDPDEEQFNCIRHYNVD